MTTRINKTDGTELVEIFDGDIDTSKTGLTLIGRLYRNYGELVNENFVKLLENFANAESPLNNLTGQLWYDTASETLNVKRTDGYVGIASLSSSAAVPNRPIMGDLWYDTFNTQLKMYNGTTWIAVTPQYTASQGKSGVFVETVRDTNNLNHIAIVTYQSGGVISIQCKDLNWSPADGSYGIGVVKPGINLVDVNSQSFNGTALNSVALGGVSYTKYLRNDIDGIIDGSLKLGNNGLTIGELDDFQLSVQDNKAFLNRADGSINLSIGVDTILQINETSQTLAIDGSDAYPAIGFINEPSSGIFRSSENVIAVGIDGSSILEVSTDGVFINGNIQANDTFVGTLSTGNLTVSTTTTTTNLNVLGTASVNALTTTGNVILGNAANDRVTINANGMHIPNDLNVYSGDLIINQDLAVGGKINGFNVSGGGIVSTGDLIVTPGLTVEGDITTIGSLVIGGNFDVNGMLILDSNGRLTLNADVVPGYTNTGDFTLGRTNGVRAYNTPKMWIAFNGTLSGLAVYDSFDIDYVTRTSTNHYTFTTENPISSGAMAVVGTNGTQLVANPSIGAITFSITTTSESAQMALVVLGQ